MDNESGLSVRMAQRYMNPRVRDDALSCTAPEELLSGSMNVRLQVELVKKPHISKVLESRGCQESLQLCESVRLLVHLINCKNARIHKFPMLALYLAWFLVNLTSF